MKEHTSHYLAVDIGGTKTALAIYSLEDQTYSPLAKGTYQNSNAGSAEDVISHFMKDVGFHPQSICLGIAGLVTSAEARVTNLPWVLRKEDFLQMGFSAVVMINDMTALAASLFSLDKEDLFCLQQGDFSGDVAAVLAPGTGLGEGFLLADNNYFIPRGTEGGHSDFAPADSEQVKLLAWLGEQRTEPISYEMTCAGPAIGTLYDFYLSRNEQVSMSVKERIEKAADRTPIIVEAGLTGKCAVCRNVLELFLSILGREGANLVTTLLATQGLYLGGGILPRLVQRTSFEPFLKAFKRPGPMSELLKTIPINIIIKPDAALLGAARYGSMIFRENSQH